mgnify:CR=1 FL=1
MRSRAVSSSSGRRGRYRKSVQYCAWIMRTAPTDPLAMISRVRAIGRSLFTDYAFPFEVTSVLILVAMVGVGLAAGMWLRNPSANTEKVAAADIAAVEQLSDVLMPAVTRLRDTLDEKARVNADIVKIESPSGDYIRQMTWPIVEGVSLMHLHVNRGKHSKLTLISAPAGFGKTTLVSEVVAAGGRPVAELE